MSLSVAITLETAIQNNLKIFSRGIFAVEFRYSEIVVFGIHNNFAYDSEN